MRSAFAAAVLLSTCFTPAFAADIAGVSKVDAVTVYPQGAEITRVAEVKLAAGDTTLILVDLPGELDAQSIRVEGDADGKIDIGSVDSKIIYLPTTSADAERARLEGAIEGLGDERAALDQAIQDAEYQKKLLLSLADKQLSPAGKDEVKGVDATALGDLVDLVSVKLGVISKTIHVAQMRQRAIDKAVYDAQAKLAAVAPAEIAHMQVSVHLTAPAAASGVFKVRYRVNSAGWAPFYDARLSSPEKDAKAKIELVRRAEVMQSTGESWDGVALTLSTARPSGATSAPDVWEEEVQVYEELRKKMKSESDGMARNAMKLDAPAAPAMEALTEGAYATKPVEQEQAVIEIAGFQALYQIAGRVTVDNSGTSKKVRIATDNYDGTLNAIAVPKIDPAAYLTAAFTIKGEAPLLPGAVNLYRDGVFMGQGALPLLNPDEEAKLGFGADDLIKVKRSEVKRQTSEEGLLTTSNVDSRAWDIVVKNLHSVAIPVTIIDQMPFSTSEDVTVEPMGGMTAVTEKDLNKRRGVVAWRFDLDAKAEKTVKFGYRVTWPENMKVGFSGQ
jgi:uncharacterized protein (TIGR02231 family)